MSKLAPQPFDTAILGRPIYRLELDAPSDLSALAALVPADAGLVSMRLPEDWPAAPEASGFRPIETLVELERPFSAGETHMTAPAIRLAAPEDADACAEIARSSFRADRYHADPMVADSLADEMKATWARNETLGRADRTFVWERDGRIEGFNGCLLKDGVMTVDLIAVSRSAQGRGIGRALLEAAFAHYAPRATRGLIATQDSNTGALALYKSLGYAETGRFRTYHFTPAPMAR